MQKYALVFLAAVLLAVMSSRSSAQCQPGWTGPVNYGLISIPNPLFPPKLPEQCDFLVHYCYYAWPTPGVTKYSYDFWIETWNCPLGSFTQEQRAHIYSAIGEELVKRNPAEFPANICGLGDNHVIVDVTHANCVYEEIVHHATPENPDAPDSYVYHGCSGSGQCFERYWVCDSCLYGPTGPPSYNCKPAPPGSPPGSPDRQRIVHKTDSWTTNSENCGTVNMPWGEVPCMTVCDADAPGPSLGLIYSRQTPTLVQTVQASTQQTKEEHQHEVRQR